MDYKAKYLKYKNKYLHLHQIQNEIQYKIQKGGFCLTKSCKLKKAGFSDKYATKGSNELNNSQIQNAILLKQAGFNDSYSYNRAKNYNGDINRIYIRNLIDLKKAGLNEFWAVEVVTKLNDSQIVTAFKLIKAGISGEYVIKAALELNESQIEKLIYFREAIGSLYREYLDDNYAFSIIKEFTDIQIKNVIDLMKAGFSIDDSYGLAKYLKGDINNGQIKNAVDLKNIGIVVYTIHIVAKKLTGSINDGQIKNALDIAKQTGLSLRNISECLYNNINSIDKMRAFEKLYNATFNRNPDIDNPNQIKNIKLVQELTPEQIDTVILLKTKNLYDYFDYDYILKVAKLDPKKIDFNKLSLDYINKIPDNEYDQTGGDLCLTKCKLLQEAGFTEYWYLKGERELNDSQIKNAIELKKSGRIDSDAYIVAQQLTGDINNGQIKVALDIAKQTGLSFKIISDCLNNNINSIDKMKALDKLVIETNKHSPNVNTKKTYDIYGVVKQNFDEELKQNVTDRSNYANSNKSRNIKLVQELTPEQIDIVILVKKYNLDDDPDLTLKVAKSDPNIVNLENLFKCGFNLDIAFRLQQQLKDTKTACELKKQYFVGNDNNLLDSIRNGEIDVNVFNTSKKSIFE
jgi:hypothetical protein